MAVLFSFGESTAGVSIPHLRNHAFHLCRNQRGGISVETVPKVPGKGKIPVQKPAGRCATLPSGGGHAKNHRAEVSNTNPSQKQTVCQALSRPCRGLLSNSKSETETGSMFAIIVLRPFDTVSERRTVRTSLRFFAKVAKS